MNIRVLFFAGLRQTAGREELRLRLASGANVLSLQEKLRSDFPGGDRLFPSVRWAVNHEFASLETQLQDGDEVALLPPMSGG
jgi:molybdopterin converting factor subunit 1